MIGHNDHLFQTCSNPLTFFVVLLSMNPFLNNSDPILDNLSTNYPLFNFIKIVKFLSKMCLNLFFYMENWPNIYDVIKQNELELAKTVFKIQPNKADNFFCFLLFVQSFNCLYLWNQLPNLCGVFTKLKP